jgi:hypothetical protein
VRNEQGEAEEVDLPANVDGSGFLEAEKEYPPDKLEDDEARQGSHQKKEGIPPACEENPYTEKREEEQNTFLTNPHGLSPFRDVSQVYIVTISPSTIPFFQKIRNREKPYFRLPYALSLGSFRARRLKDSAKANLEVRLCGRSCGITEKSKIFRNVSRISACTAGKSGLFS